MTELSPMAIWCTVPAHWRLFGVQVPEHCLAVGETVI